MNLQIQTTSLAAFEAAKYSASIVKSVVVLWLALFQLNASPFRQNNYPDCAVSVSLEASVGVTFNNQFFVASIH